MSSPVKLVAPYPTMDEVAEVYGISPARLKRLKKMVQSLTSRGRVRTSVTPLKRSAPRVSQSTSPESRNIKSSHNGHKKRAADKKYHLPAVFVSQPALRLQVRVSVPCLYRWRERIWHDAPC